MSNNSQNQVFLDGAIAGLGTWDMCQ